MDSFKPNQLNNILPGLTEEDYYLNAALLETYFNQNKIDENLENLNQVIENSFVFDSDKKPESENEKLFLQVYPKLNDFQKEIFQECITKKSAGLSLPLGTGKTLLALTLSLYLNRENNCYLNNNANNDLNKDKKQKNQSIKTKKGPILIVAAKSLIASWAFEIQKFFGDSLKYEIVHQSTMKEDLAQWKIKPETQIVLTTADVLSKFYKENHIDGRFITQKFIHQMGGAYVNFYDKPKKPYLNHVIGGGLFFSIEWGCLVIDEAQAYTNIETRRCQALGAIYTQHRWLLSGTLFDEPKVERILGYHILLNAPDKPRNLPDTKNLVWGIGPTKFKGLQEHLVIRKSNQAFTPPKINEQIITHQLMPEEEKIYTMMREILVEVKKKAEHAKLTKNVEELKKFSSYKMVMIMYLRQALICPLIPIASIAIDVSDMEKKSQLSKLVMNEIGGLGIDKYLDNPESVKSTRVQATLDALSLHPKEKVIIFSCFKSYLDIMEHFLPKDRPILRMTANMSLQKRGQLVEEFRQTDNGILLMTYELGANGLNLQFAATVMLVDFWWNAARTQQAIGRIFRFGQIADQVNIYFFSANTGIEKIIFEKQSAKLQILEELKTGSQQSKVPNIKMDEVIQMIDEADNKKLLKEIEFY